MNDLNKTIGFKIYEETGGEIMASFVKENILDAFKNIQSFPSNIIDSKINSTKDAKPILLLDELIKKFAQSFSKGTKPDETIDNEAKYILNIADKDKNGTVSFEELNQFDSSAATAEMGTKINNLKDKFRIYDKDQSGELSLAEIKNALGTSQYSLQELGAMADEDKTVNQDKAIFEEKSLAPVQSAVNNYKKANSYNL